MEAYELTPLGENNKAMFVLRAMGHKTPAADGSSPTGNNALALLKIEYRGKSIETVINEGSVFTLETMSGKVEQLGSDGDSATLLLSFLHDVTSTGI
jgi:hypothetical protein